MHQIPECGEHLLFFRGDSVKFILKLNEPLKGKAFLRTNIGNAEIHRNEIIRNIEANIPPTGMDWHDLSMERQDDNNFSITVGLAEVGHFEAKCFFYPENTSEAIWVHGENVQINVEPAAYCAANSIYCAFVRQFGINKDREASDLSDNYIQNINKLDEKGFTVIPHSGTFRDLQEELDFIFDKLHCRILHLLPVNPVPTTYARMGRFGSPYASLDYTAVDPALAEFDRRVTPMEQFFELIDGVHMENGKVILDLAINHTGWASKIHETHPEWLKRDADGNIHSPGAWGVTWADLTELDNNHLELWQFFADVFTTWCERGIDGFRCDAGYMIPAPVWEYIIARVRKQHPDTIFLLEGLGGDPAVTRELLNKANMNWAYSELFQNYSSQEIKNYIPFALKVSQGDGLMVNYAETHDNTRLAAISPVYSKMRTTLCALTSTAGAFGFANGVEWFATERIDVHESSALNWGAKSNQIENIAKLNLILGTHPAFAGKGRLEFFNATGTDPKFNRDVLGFIRTTADGRHPLLVLCNLNCEQKTRLCFELSQIKISEHKPLIDMLTEKEWKLEILDNGEGSVLLEPGEIICLTNEMNAIMWVRNAAAETNFVPESIILQQAKAMVMDLLTVFKKSPIITEEDDIAKYAEFLLEDPYNNFASFFNKGHEIPLVKWECPADLKRQVMVPPGHAIFVTAPTRFRVSLRNQQQILIQRDSLEDTQGNNFIILPSLPVKYKAQKLTIKIAQFGAESLSRESSEIIFLSNGDSSSQLVLSNREIREFDSTYLATNGRGGMLHIPVSCCGYRSRYEALLAGNLNSDYPVDRRIMWNGCRIWIRNETHTQNLSVDNISFFSLLSDGRGCWNFHIPAGNGKFVDLRMTLKMLTGRNATKMEIERLPAEQSQNYLDDDIPITVGIRIDVEDRSFHEITKANETIRKSWEKAISVKGNSLTFKPNSERSLFIEGSKTSFDLVEKTVNDDSENEFDFSVFKLQPEWRYNLYRELEASRGLESKTDTFSPGYFEIKLTGGSGAVINGEILMPGEKPEIDNTNVSIKPEKAESFAEILQRGMQHYIVKRDELKTVIAGYPWFLDWGRDTLICTRGMIKAGLEEEVAEIILAFAKFAENGTLPNIIHGAEAGNRDTSDAPLWLFTACADFCKEFPLIKLLDKNVPGKETNLLGILEEIAEAYISGTPNGIKMDGASGLIFSPAHFTWMDTNYPAGTPREGYPIEIQALWSAALDFLARETEKSSWAELAEKVKKSIGKYYVRPEGWLSDCLHAKSGTPAAKALQDDALRPNQLLAITLGAIDDYEIRCNILKGTSCLLVPGAIRSLANRHVEVPIPIKGANGNLLNDPQNPYWGYYEGDEDTRRKPAYHNGTAWTWLFPSYAEAYYMTYCQNGQQTAKSILSSSKPLLQKGCIGQIPEILDGNAPHNQRGCDAQAWGVTELYRVWQELV